MKKVLFIALCVCTFSVAAVAREEYDAKQTKPCQDGLLCDLNNETLSGIVKEYDDQENLRSEVTYFNGRKSGVARTYYKNGNLRSEGSYVYGKKVGKDKKYYESGELKAELTYKNGERNGTTRMYDEAGELKAKILFKNGKAISGTIYDEDGNGIKMTNAHLHSIDNGKMPSINNK